jgi:hypothetical protein
MKKRIALLFGAAIALGALVAPATIATASCADQAIWTQESDGTIKKWSTSGELLSTLDNTIAEFDMAISSDLATIYTVSGSTLSLFDAVTGEPKGTETINGFTGSPVGGGVVAGGKLIVDKGELLYAIDLTNFDATVFADLSNATSSLPEEQKAGSSFSIAGDIVQHPVSGVLAIVNHLSSAGGLGLSLLRIDNADPTKVEVVGTLDVDSAVYGAGRAGDSIFLATDSGSLYKVGTIPVTASTELLTTTLVVTDPDGVTFYGAAGSNDSTEGSAGSCESEPTSEPAPATTSEPAPATTSATPLAKTGVDSWSTAALALLALAMLGYGARLALSGRTRKS